VPFHCLVLNSVGKFSVFLRSWKHKTMFIYQIVLHIIVRNVQWLCLSCHARECHLSNLSIRTRHQAKWKVHTVLFTNNAPSLSYDSFPRYVFYGQPRVSQVCFVWRPATGNCTNINTVNFIFVTEPPLRDIIRQSTHRIEQLTSNWHRGKI